MAFYESEVPDPGAPPLDWDLPRWAGPTPAMTQALALVQADLDAAGLDHFGISYAVAGGSDDYPIVNVQWRGTWTSDSIDFEEVDLAAVTVDVARQLAQGLIELEETYWPTCPTHGVRARAGLALRGSAVWGCDHRGSTPHRVSDIGDLASLRSGRALDKPLWRTLKDLPRP